MSTRKIINASIIIVGILVLGYMGWKAFDIFSNATPDRNRNTAVATAKEIRDAELKAKAEGGKYISLQELIDKKTVPAGLASYAYYGYRFNVETTENEFLIDVVPVGDTTDGSFTMN